MHVICLPLQLKITDRKHPIADIAQAVSLITQTSGSAWRHCEGDNPWASPLLSDEQRWQARVYFHPFVRRFLYDPQRVCWLQRTDVSHVAVTLKGSSDPLTLTVSRCLMALFQPDIACVLLELEYRADEGQPALTMESLQRLLDQLRRTYPPYFDTDKNDKQQKDRPFGGHCPSHMQFQDAQHHPIGKSGSYTPDAYASSKQQAAAQGSWKPGWAAHWKSLLAPLHTDDTSEDDNSIGIRQFGDDRAAVMSYVAFDNVRALNQGQWVRLCFADDYGTDPLPYAGRFLQGFEEKHCYDRYWYNNTAAGEPLDSTDSPSRILNCGYAFTNAGQQDTWVDQHGRTQPGFFGDATNGALFTFRHIYIIMGLIAHMQRAALLAASHRLTEMVERKATGIELPPAEKVRDFYKQFVEFTQTYWFDEISPQEQGQQLFARWRAHLRIGPLYDEVRQELRDLAEYSELQASRIEYDQSKQLNETVGMLGLGSVLIAVFSAIAGAFGMNPLAEWVPLIAIPVLVLVLLTTGLLLYKTNYVWQRFIPWQRRQRQPVAYPTTHMPEGKIP
ncbi:MAG: hypothetical protein PHH58_03355 [Rhodoferax sp.]|nr:hypothetical protein [Rhodoferax sp.]